MPVSTNFLPKSLQAQQLWYWYQSSYIPLSAISHSKFCNPIRGRCATLYVVTGVHPFNKMPFRVLAERTKRWQETFSKSLLTSKVPATRGSGFICGQVCKNCKQSPTRVATSRYPVSKHGTDAQVRYLANSNKTLSGFQILVQIEMESSMPLAHFTPNADMQFSMSVAVGL